MAGDWLKIEKITIDKEEVYRMAAFLGIAHEVVFAKLFRVWSWVDSVSRDGHAFVTLETIDSIAGCARFGHAMAEAQWVIPSASGGLFFPNFTRHMGQSAKSRALAADRQKQKRCHDSVTQMSRSDRDKSVTREEKRREENTKEPTAQGQAENAKANHMAEAFDAFRRLTRLNTVQADAALARYHGDSLAGTTITIGGERADSWRLIASACSDAIRTGQTPNSITGAVSLIRAIVERCIRDGAWPGEFIASEKPAARADAAPDLAAIIADAQRKSAVARQIGAVNATE